MNEIFIHVDVDDLWAIGECYGIRIPEPFRHHVYDDGLPRLLGLLEQLSIRATFFVCGADLESEKCVALLRDVIRRGHKLANHSFSHHLAFRNLDEPRLRDEILRTHRLAEDQLGIKMLGFRAPGYAWSRRLVRILAELGYLYDSSLMPSPFGWVFRLLDRQLSRAMGASTSLQKTQFPRFTDAWHALRPYEIVWRDTLRIWELPVAAAPVLRIPMQASVCLQLGPRYFAFLRKLLKLCPMTPFVFLLHGADLTDFRQTEIPALSRSKYFSMPVSERLSHLREYLESLLSDRHLCVAEELFEQRAGCL